jgi:hypothetical protein
VAFALAWAAPARGQGGGTGEALAASLFEEGRSLMNAGRMAEACAKFEESERLVRAPGTLLNLAVCHEQVGKIATAWAEFRQSESWALRDGRQDRAVLAQDHMRALEPRLPRLVVTVPPASDAPSLVVRVDASELGRAAWGSPFPVDPGRHVVEAEAPGKRPWSGSVTIESEGESEALSVPPLEDVPSPAPGPAAPRSESPAPPETGLPARRVAALVLGGAGVAAFLVGGYFGLSAIAKHNDSNAECPQGLCTPAGVADNDAAGRAADASTVAFGIGLAALAAGAILWFSTHAPAGSGKARVLPSVAGPAPGPALGVTF